MATIFLEYLHWHFAIAPGELLHIMLNYIRATWHRFLIIQHLKTLFAPWRRRQPSDLANKLSWGAGDKILNFIADLYIRLLAAVVRSVVVVIGLVSEIFVVVFFLTLLILWLFWPFLAIYFFLRGLVLIF